MTTFTLQDKIISTRNNPNGTFGDEVPSDAQAGDTVICGNDTISGSGYLAGDVGQGLGLTVHVVGGNDRISGSASTDIINGGGGNDSVDGGAGFDYAEYIDFTQQPFDRVVVDLAAGQSWSSHFGNDRLTGIEGVIGSFGADWIAGARDANELYGHDGDDVIYGRDGTDMIDGGSGNDALYGEAGDDRLVDTGGQNWMSGGDGHDTLIVSGGRPGEWSAVHGDAGDDTLEGSSSGSSVGLYGDAGNDLIRFGSGVSYIHGGSGADRFGPSAAAFTDAASFAQIFDFEDGIDKITLSGIAGARFDVHDWGANTGVIITDAGGHATTLMLMGVTKTQIGPATDILTG